MEENLSKFEFNNETLNDFDSLMALHLDQIEELTITSISSNPKFYNIIGLCINLKTLKIVGNLKINTNNIISNIFKPDMIENIIFDGVRLPTIKSISKFSNIKTITLNNIRYSSIKGFLNNISKENVEELYFEDTDFCRAPISLVEEFKNLRILNIKRCNNCKYDSYKFLAENRFLDKVNIDSAFIGFDQLANFVKGKADKNISAQLGKTTKKSLVNKFYIKNNEINIIINSSKLKDLSDNLNFNRIDKMILNLNKNADLIEYMKLLKRVKKEIILSIKNLSYLSTEDAELFKEQFNVKKIKVVSSVEDSTIEINDSYDIDNYIYIRKRIDELIHGLLDDEKNELEKVIEVYKAILLSEKVDIIESGSNILNQMNNIVNNIFTDLNYAELFYNCLESIGINTKIIKGENSDGKIRYWNQVKIYDYWYNVDLYLDAKLNSKNEKIDKRPKYFLLTEKEFFKDHKPKIMNYEHCMVEIDKKVISSYFKIQEKDSINIIVKIVNKIKRLFAFNKKTEKLLPEPSSEIQKTYSKDEFSNEEIDILNQIDELDNED